LKQLEDTSPIWELMRLGFMEFFLEAAEIKNKGDQTLAKLINCS
jgi:hypothetical protein